MRVVARLAAALSTIVLVGCRPPSEPVPRPGPQRIVALSPAITQVMRDLKVADRLVGRHGYDRWADPDVAICGDQAGIDYEALLRANPTDVLLEWGDRPLPERLLAMADANGWSVDSVSTDSVADVGSLVRSLGALTAQEDEAAALIQLMHDAFDTPIDALRRPDRLLILMGVDPPAAIGPGSIHHEILTRMGAGMAMETGAPYMQLDGESVASLRPDTILLVGVGEIKPGPVNPARLGIVGRLRLPATESARVVAIGHPMALVPSTSLIGVATEIRQAIEAMQPVRPSDSSQGTPGRPDRSP